MRIIDWSSDVCSSDLSCRYGAASGCAGGFGRSETLSRADARERECQWTETGCTSGENGRAIRSALWRNDLACIRDLSSAAPYVGPDGEQGKAGAWPSCAIWRQRLV